MGRLFSLHGNLAPAGIQLVNPAVHSLCFCTVLSGFCTYFFLIKFGIESFFRLLICVWCSQSALLSKCLFLFAKWVTKSVLYVSFRKNVFATGTTLRTKPNVRTPTYTVNYHVIDMNSLAQSWANLLVGGPH